MDAVGGAGAGEEVAAGDALFFYVLLGLARTAFRTPLYPGLRAAMYSRTLLAGWKDDAPIGSNFYFLMGNSVVLADTRKIWRRP